MGPNLKRTPLGVEGTQIKDSILGPQKGNFSPPKFKGVRKRSKELRVNKLKLLPKKVSWNIDPFKSFKYLLLVKSNIKGRPNL